jgi:putative oxidoreductase
VKSVVPILALICRFVLGAVFVVAGATKAYDPAAFAEQIGRFHLLPWPIGAALALWVPWLEMFAGMLVITQKLLLGALLILTVSLLIFSLALLSAWLRGLNIDCGCFGHALPRMTLGWALLRNLLLLILVGILWRESLRNR